jgi:heme A synthase
VAAIAFLLAVIVLGAMVVLRGIGPGLAALDLGSALMVLALVLAATTVAAANRSIHGGTYRLSFHGAYARLALGALALTFVVLVSAVLVAEPGSVTRCLGWPGYTALEVAPGLRGTVTLGRFLASLVAALLIVAVAIQAWRTKRPYPAVRLWATLALMLLLVECLIGALIPASNLAILLLSLYAALAAALWAVLVVLTVLAGLLDARPAVIPRPHS